MPLVRPEGFGFGPYESAFQRRGRQLLTKRRWHLRNSETEDTPGEVHGGTEP